MFTLSKRVMLYKDHFRCYSSLKESVPQQNPSNFVPVFSFPFVKYISLLNRLKVYHIFGSSAAIPGCGILEAVNALPSGALLTASYIGVTGVAVLTLASLPFKNTIGFIYVSEDNEKVKISSMDFWGRRIDREVSVEDWIPIMDLNPRTMDPVYLTSQLTDGTKYKLFLKFGAVLNPTKMGQVLE